tara:strand:+ start:15284 stop:16198 length:915 start_codon:yes stop_codon:yes gene_type:complete
MNITKKKNRNKNKNFTIKNCGPRVSGKTIHKNSCLTKELIFDLKNEYNKKYPNNLIEANNPKKIWNELNKKMKSCNSEDCWLIQLSKPEIKDKIYSIIFSPKKPKSWDKNPNEWLSNFDILNVLVQYEDTFPEFEFLGPSFIDFDKTLLSKNYKCVDNDLCKFNLKDQIDKKKYKIGIIFNLDEHTQDGSHWVSLFIDIDNEFIFFFDSVGTKIPSEIKKLVDRIIHQGKNLKNPIYFTFYENHPMEHQFGDTECGMYSLFFIITLLTHKINSKKKSLSYLINFFKKKRITDKQVENLRYIYYN